MYNIIKDLILITLLFCNLIFNLLTFFEMKKSIKIDNVEYLPKTVKGRTSNTIRQIQEVKFNDESEVMNYRTYKQAEEEKEKKKSPNVSDFLL